MNNYHFALGWSYRSGEPYTPISNFNTSTKEVVFGNLNSKRLQAHHRLDASFRNDFILSIGKQKAKAQFGISALNIYNRKIPISLVHRVENENNSTQLKQVIQRFSLGTTFNFSFRVFF